MRNSICSFIFVLICYSGRGQSKDCLIFTETFNFITIDIRSQHNYPIIMHGVTKYPILDKLNLEGIDSFLRSFYKFAFFTPDIPSGIEKGVLFCFGDSLGFNYLEQHKLENQSLFGKIKKNSKRETLYLKSSEAVFIEITNVKGTFWRFNGNFKGISRSSNEVDIRNIPVIEICYVPFKIECIRKPKRRLL